MNPIFDTLARIEASVVSDPEILGGTPVVRGTRVPVYDVAASVAAGISIERILTAYPSLNREQVDTAALYAKANPPAAIRRKRSPLPGGAKIIARRTRAISKLA
jgi:uncharacterized protein (DUF433 family)